MPDTKYRPQQDFARALKPAAIIAKFHLGLSKIPNGSVERGDTNGVDQFPQQPSGKMRVAENTPADRARRASPCFETCQAMIDRPADEAVDGDTRLCAHETFARQIDLSTTRSDDQSSDTLVANQQIRSPSQNRHSDPRLRGELESTDSLIGTASLEKPVGRAAYFERRQWRQRNIAANSIGTESGNQAIWKGHRKEYRIQEYRIQNQNSEHFV